MKKSILFLVAFCSFLAILFSVSHHSFAQSLQGVKFTGSLPVCNGSTDNMVSIATGTLQVCYGSVWSPVSGNAATAATTTWVWNGTTSLYPSSTSWNVGIGTTSPSEKLQVAGNVVVSNNSGYGWGGRTTRIDGSDYLTNDYMQFIVNNGSAMYINSSGNVGIGTSTPPSMLSVFGNNATASSAGLLSIATGTVSSLFVNSAGKVIINYGKPLGTGAGHTEFLQVGGAGTMVLGNTNTVGGEACYNLATYPTLQTGADAAFCVQNYIVRFKQLLGLGNGYTNAMYFTTAGFTHTSAQPKATAFEFSTTQANSGTAGSSLIHGLSTNTSLGSGNNYLLELGTRPNTTTTEALQFGVLHDGSIRSAGTGSNIGSTSTPAGVFAVSSSSVERLSIANNGNVGIATTTPSYVLDVVGTGKFTQPLIVGTPTAASHAATKTYVDSALGGTNYWGLSGSTLSASSTAWDITFGDGSGTDLTVGGGAGKIDVGTVDPVYTIQGQHYATYMAGMTGVKEETTGVILLQKNNAAVLDFKNAEIGSDLWLFAKTTNLKKNFNALSVLLTPGFSGNVWYKKDAENLRVLVYSSGNGEISYRLTAPRFDAANWKNLRTEEGEGFNLDKLIRE